MTVALNFAERTVELHEASSIDADKSGGTPCRP